MEAVVGLVGRLAFGQDAPPDRDDRIGGDQVGAGQFRTQGFDLSRRLDLLAGEADRQAARLFETPRRFSSMSAGNSASTFSPACSSRASRLGEAEASTSLGRDVLASGAGAGSAVTKGAPPL